MCRASDEEGHLCCCTHLVTKKKMGSSRRLCQQMPASCLTHTMKSVCAGLQTRKATSAAAAKVKGMKGKLITAEATIRRHWSKIKRSVGSVSGVPL